MKTNSAPKETDETQRLDILNIDTQPQDQELPNCPGICFLLLPKEAGSNEIKQEKILEVLNALISCTQSIGSLGEGIYRTGRMNPVGTGEPLPYIFFFLAADFSREELRELTIEVGEAVKERQVLNVKYIETYRNRQRIWRTPIT